MVKMDQPNSNVDCAKRFLKRAWSQKKTYYPEHNIMVEALIEFEGSNDNILLISPKEHTTDPENMVYTWLDQLLVFFIMSPKEHTTDPKNMVYTWFDNYIFIYLLLSKLPDFTCHRSREHDMLL